MNNVFRFFLATFLLSTAGLKIFQQLFNFQPLILRIFSNFCCKQKVAEKAFNQQLKVKKFWKIWKLAVASKKVGEKSENSWKQKSCWKIFQPAVESKKVAEISENQWLKAKKLLKNLKKVESKKVAEIS